VHEAINTARRKQPMNRSITMLKLRDVGFLLLRWSMPVQAEKVIGRIPKTGSSVLPLLAPYGRLRENIGIQARMVSMRSGVL